MTSKELDLVYRPIDEDVFHQPLYSNITIQDSVETLIINYKGKEYKFDLEKVLKLLCKEL
mgnify:CR=1 FL=1